MDEKTNKIEGLENIESAVYTLKDIDGLNTEGLTFVFVIDSFTNRGKTNSTKNFLINTLAEGFYSVKELENKLSRYSKVKENFSRYEAKRKIDGKAPRTLREYLRERIIGNVRYYTNSNVISDIFKGFTPFALTVDNKGVKRYTLAGRLIPTNAK